MRKKLKILFVVLIFILCTGCSSTIKDGKEVVTNKETGQTLTSNIICKPTDENLLETYTKYNDKLQVKLEDLPTCSNFTPNKSKISLSNQSADLKIFQILSISSIIFVFNITFWANLVEYKK